MNAPSRIQYAHKAKVRSYAEQLTELRAAGLDVAALKVSPDGTIEIFSTAAFPTAPRDEFEAWDQAGKLG